MIEEFKVSTKYNICSDLNWCVIPLFMRIIGTCIVMMLCALFSVDIAIFCKQDDSVRTS